MEMSFYQLQLEAGWVRNTKKVTASVSCKNCNQEVPVVRWDKELDAFYKAEKTQLHIKSSFKTGTVGKFLIWLNVILFWCHFPVDGRYIYLSSHCAQTS